MPLNDWAWHREVRFHPGLGLALSRAFHIGDENWRQGIERRRPSDKAGVITLGRIALYGDLCTVHVHLAVANLVEPRPSQKSVARRRIRRNLEFVLLREGAAAEHRLDDMESLAGVVGERDLAGSSPVRGTARKLHLVLVTRSVISD